MAAPGRKRKTYDVVIDMTPTTFTSAKSRVAMCAGEAGVVVAHGQACWEAPSSSGNGMWDYLQTKEIPPLYLMVTYSLA